MKRPIRLRMANRKKQKSDVEGSISGPQRTCIACRETRDKRQLLRYVVAPDGMLLVDYRQRLPGRGTYTCVSRQCLRDAVKRKAFQRSLKEAPEGVDADRLETQLREAVSRKIAGLIGMARKSGQVVTGTQAVTEVLKKDPAVAVVLLAEDISSAIGQKIDSLCSVQGVPCAQLYDKQSIGQLLGKEERSAVAVLPGPLAQALVDELHRYEQLVREN